MTQGITNVVDYMNRYNDLQVTLNQYIAHKDKYNLDTGYLDELNIPKNSWKILFMVNDILMTLLVEYNVIITNTNIKILNFLG